MFTDKIGSAIFTDLSTESKFTYIPQIKTNQCLPEGIDFFQLNYPVK